MKYFVILNIILFESARAGLIFPEDNSQLHYTHIAFEWEQQADAVEYQLQVAVDINFNHIIIDIGDPSLIHIVKNGIDWGQDYYWRVRGLKSNGVQLDWIDTFSFSVGEYEEIMSLSTEMWDESSYSPGYNLFGSLIAKKSWIMDENGDFIWFSDSLNIIPSSNFLPNGNLLAMYFSDDGLVSYDAKLGIEHSIDEEIIWSNPDSLLAHHDLIVLPNNNYLMIIKETRNGPIPHGSWTSSFQDIGFIADGVVEEFPWEGDRIVEINAQTKEIEWSWSVFDHYSMVDFDSLGGNWNNALDFMFYDWTHCNSLYYDEIEDAIYVSSRHLSRITKIDYESGEIIWNMGHQMESDDIDFGEDICFSYQHNVTLLDNGNLLFLDNGNLSQFYCGTEDRLTRALEISITEDNEDYSADIEWSLTLPEEYAGTFMGSCIRLQNGNTLINPGAILNGAFGRAFEVNQNGEYVWEMSSNAIINRMYRVLGLYPQKFSIIQPNFVWYLPDPTIYLSIGDNCLHYVVTNEGHSNQLYEYSFQDNGIWFDDESGVIEIEAGGSYELIFSGSVFYEIYPHTISLNVYPLDSPNNGKNVSINAWSTHNDISGCNDPIACNYDADAVIDNCSCSYDCVGDLNLDNSIDIFDIVLIIEIILSNNEITDFQNFVADFDQSGSIDVNDIIAIIEFIL